MNGLIKRRMVIEFHLQPSCRTSSAGLLLMSWSSYLQFCKKPCLSYLPSPSVYHSTVRVIFSRSEPSTDSQRPSKLFMVADKAFYDLASVYCLSLPSASSLYLAGFASGVLSGWTHPVSFI